MTYNKLFKTEEDKAIFWLAKMNSSTFSQQHEQEFFKWLEASPLHQAAYIKAEELWERGEVVARLPEPTKNTPVFFNFWQGWGLTLASFAGVFLLFGVYLATGNTSYDLQTGIGEQQSVQLKDGSQLFLNTNSAVEVSLSRKSRTVKLKHGEVFFDVAADASRPFDVVTTAGVVRVLGTHFAVRETVEDALVTVIEGRVALGNISAAQEFAPLSILTANEQSSFHAAKKGATPEVVNAKSLLSWRNKQLVYKGEPLSQVVLDLNRYFTSEITLSDAMVGEREVTAVIRLADVQTTIQALCASLNLRADFNSDATKIVLSPAVTAP